MITKIIDENLIQKAKKELLAANNIVITAHISPDGDAIGSSLGLCNFLHAIGKKATVVVPNGFPAFLKWLPGAKDILVFKDNRHEAVEALKAADLFVTLDYNELTRLGPDMEAVARTLTCTKIMIDHHLKPELFSTVTISYPLMSSTCEMIFRLICRMGYFDVLSKEIAECIYTGMMTDTGNFSYNSNSSELYIIISELLRKGINKDEIYHRVFNSYTADRYRMMGFALSKMEIIEEYGTAIITMSRAELNKYNYHKGDTEGFVNMPLSIKGVCLSAFYKEEDGLIKVSLRSHGEVPCNIIASDLYNGGGHKNASGGEAHGDTLDGAAAKLREALPKYADFIKAELENDNR